MPKTKKFKKLLKGIEKQYLGKKVPKKFQKKYGEKYDKKETKSVAFAIAKSKGWKI